MAELNIELRTINSSLVEGIGISLGMVFKLSAFQSAHIAR